MSDVYVPRCRKGLDDDKPASGGCGLIIQSLHHVYSCTHALTNCRSVSIIACSLPCLAWPRGSLRSSGCQFNQSINQSGVYSWSRRTEKRYRVSSPYLLPLLIHTKHTKKSHTPFFTMDLTWLCDCYEHEHEHEHELESYIHLD